MNDWKELDDVDLEKPSEKQAIYEEVAIAAGIGAVYGVIMNYILSPYAIGFANRMFIERRDIERWEETTLRMTDNSTLLFFTLATYPLIYIITESFKMPKPLGVLIGIVLGTLSVALMTLVNGYTTFLPQEFAMHAMLCGIAGYIFVYLRKDAQDAIG